MADTTSAAGGARPPRRHTWNTTDLPGLSGRTAVITGANSGIGFAAADALARAGAHVVLAVRDQERGRAAASRISGSTEVRRLDLADLASVRDFAASWTATLDLLINNAGVMMLPSSGRRTASRRSSAPTTWATSR